MKKTFSRLAALAMAYVPLFAAASSLPTDVVTGEGAWCWFADPRAIHYESPDGGINATWLGYIDVHGNVKASQYDFVTGERGEVLVRSFFQPDDHNNPTFLVLPDGRVMIMYSRHTDEPAFYYRISRRPGDILDLGDEKRIETANNTTYPSPFILSDDPDHFYLCWRGIGWHPTIARFTLPDDTDEVRAVWGPYQIVQSTGARPYAKYRSNGKDKIYFSYTTGHPDNEMPNWLYLNVVNIGGQNGADGEMSAGPVLEDINGKRLSVIEEGPFRVDKSAGYKEAYPATVIDSPDDARDWLWEVALDDGEKPVVAMVRINGEKDCHDYYRASWNGSGWNVSFLCNAGGHFHSSPATEKCYSGGEAIDPDDTDVMYLSVPTPGAGGDVYEIWRYVCDADGQVVSRRQITENSEKNNVRPFVIPGSEGSPMRLAWMNGDYYYWMTKKGFEKGYPTSIKSDYVYETTVAEKSPLFTFSGEDGSLGEIPVEGPQFSLAVSLSVSPEAFFGTLLSSPRFVYGLDRESKRPFVEVDGKRHFSSNPLLTSDNWASNSTGTHGDWWPTIPGKIELAFVYDGKRLTVYRGGLVDQVVEVEGLDLSGLTRGSFAGSIDRVEVYGHPLTQEGVKTLL